MFFKTYNTQIQIKQSTSYAPMIGDFFAFTSKDIANENPVVHIITMLAYNHIEYTCLNDGIHTVVTREGFFRYDPKPLRQSVPFQFEFIC